MVLPYAMALLPFAMATLLHNKNFKYILKLYGVIAICFK